MVNINRITQIFNETKIQSESSLWVKIRKDRISASLKAHKIKSCRDLSIQNQDKLAISLLTNKDLGYRGKINVAYGKQFENMALDFYSKSLNISVIKCGVIE